jgi:hypothetical protein
MPQFILGLFFGSLFTGAELIGAIFLLPFVAVFFAAVAWGCYEAVVWYDATSASYTSAAWYAWPWHWPGAHLTQEIFGALELGHPAEPQGDMLRQALAWAATLPKAGFAIVINMFVAMIPIYLMGYGFRIVRWIRSQNIDAGHVE